MRKTTIGMLLLLCTIVYFIFGAIETILVGLGKKEDSIRHIKKKSTGTLVTGIIGLIFFLLSFVGVSVIIIIVIFF